jgi:hypothetical protein
MLAELGSTVFSHPVGSGNDQLDDPGRLVAEQSRQRRRWQSCHLSAWMGLEALSRQRVGAWVVPVEDLCSMPMTAHVVREGAYDQMQRSRIVDLGPSWGAGRVGSFRP